MMKKLLSIILISIVFSGFSQEAPENWFTLDPELDSVQGVSADRILKEMEGQQSRTVIVAVIDSGVDIEHEDLKDKIWNNENEIPDNGKDDDNNGFVDDVNGWNFIGGSEGENVNKDTYELTREYVRLKAKYDGVEKPKKKNKTEYAYWEKVKESFLSKYEDATTKYDFYKNLRDNTIRYHKLITAYLGTDNLTVNSVNGINSNDSIVAMAAQTVAMILLNMGEDADFDEVATQLDDAVEYFESQALYGYNVDFNPRSIVGDDWDNGKEIGYGNNDVIGPDASHGTHVSGIIAANRNNNIGIRGIAENVKIMPIRAVPDGDERDKDVANAIRYAVDNGAHIINMSFGKSYSYRKYLVDEAINYAESKGVLCIHAAGNSSENLDEESNFPTPEVDGKRVNNWLEIGASSWGSGEQFVGSFSNYGKSSVDVFAPGVKVYSTTPNNTYDSYNGTSMASPSTAGVAAIVMSFFPELSASQVKEILFESARGFGDLKVNKPGTADLVNFDTLSRSGGLVNAKEAVEMAQKIVSSIPKD